MQEYILQSSLKNFQCLLVCHQIVPTKELLALWHFVSVLQLRYYDSEEDANCKGYIDLFDVISVQSIKNVQGAPKKSDENAFFEVKFIVERSKSFIGINIEGLKYTFLVCMGKWNGMVACKSFSSASQRLTRDQCPFICDMAERLLKQCEQTTTYLYMLDNYRLFSTTFVFAFLCHWPKCELLFFCQALHKCCP